MFDVFGLRGFSRYLETRVRVLHMLQRIVGTQLLDGAPRELRSAAVACFIRDMRQAQIGSRHHKLPHRAGARSSVVASTRDLKTIVQGAENINSADTSHSIGAAAAA